MSYENYIPQSQLVRLRGAVKPGRVAIVYGPRRVGKTTLIRHYVAELKEPALLLTGEDINVRDYLESQSVEKLKALVGQHRYLVVDEAQHVRQIGLNLKLLVDHVPGLCVVATGSSSFELAGQTGEPLTGRKTTLLMLPLAQLELAAVETPPETRARLEQRLIYGSYPEVVLAASDAARAEYLRELVASYLLKDILQLEQIRQSEKLLRLLQLVAFQIGGEVSLGELAQQLAMSRNTVERYLDLFEKVFVLVSRHGFSRNLRKELSKSRRYYFIDNGIRNALISNFNPVALRDDIGALWENYLLIERWKAHLYLGRDVQSFFWRTHDRQEIDLVEESAGKLSGFDAKWSETNAKTPAAWRSAYPKASFEVVNRESYLPFIT